MRARTRATAAGLCLVALLAAGSQAAQVQAPERDARAMLARGDELRLAARGRRGGERLELRARAVEVYSALRRRFPAARDEGAQAAFRAGELLRSDGHAGAARTEFSAALDLAVDAELGARAGLELGHLARRAGLHEQALGHYSGVAAEGDAAAQERDTARLWVGRTQTALARHEEARATLEALARGARDPVVRVSAHDERALSWIAVGDLEACAGELARCRGELRSSALEQTPQGARVRSALRHMRAVGRLRAAVAERESGVVIER